MLIPILVIIISTMIFGVKLTPFNDVVVDCQVLTFVNLSSGIVSTTYHFDDFFYCLLVQLGLTVLPLILQHISYFAFFPIGSWIHFYWITICLIKFSISKLRYVAYCQHCDMQSNIKCTLMCSVSWLL